MKKQFFFVIAAIWMSFIMFDKTVDASMGMAFRKQNILIRFILMGIRLFKSMMLITLVVVNIFMAISMIDDKKKVE